MRSVFPTRFLFAAALSLALSPRGDGKHFIYRGDKHLFWIVDDQDGPQGIPVKTIAYRDGQPAFQSEVKEVKKQDFAAAIFEVPAGLAKKQMGAGRQP